ncbi:FlgD immunoglobulin-like domain containing protein [Ekhidna sp.]|uniref:FlgD immunoglobulin-like domain containing protein n=1 Tax=Ekhidna sp. TaxID=2608089 RepID=UPI003B50DB36
MKRLLWVLFLASIGGERVKSTFEYSIHIIESPSEIVGKEDLMGRVEYLQLLARDPETGTIPNNIHQTELIFERQLAANTSNLRTQQLSIQSLGPNNVGGRTRAVAFDSRDENIIIAGGVSGGIWKSIDGGLSWVKKSNPENRNSVTCLVQDTRPGREDTWYHGTGEIVGNSAGGGAAPFRGNGIYKSIDNGESWEPLVSTQNTTPNFFFSPFQYIWNIEINPTNLDEDEIIVAAFGGILRSTDGGDNWEVMLGRDLLSGDTIDLNRANASYYTSLERSENNVFYAGLSTETPIGDTLEIPPPDAGIFYSLSGQDWTEITPATSESRYRRIAIGSSPSDPDITYFMIDSSPILILEHKLSLMDDPQRIFGFDPSPRVIPDVDENLGVLNTQGSYNMMISVHPEDPNIVFVGGTNLFRSTDAFRTKESIDWVGGYHPEGGSGEYPNHHPDQHDLLFLPSDPNVAISANDGGLRITDDIVSDSVLWESRNNGFVTSQFFTIAQSKNRGESTVIGGMQDNGTDISSGGLSWNGVIGGDGSYVATTNDNLLWFTSFQRGQTLRLTFNDSNGITSFARVDPGSLVAQEGSLYLFINPYVLDPLNQNRMFFAGGNHLYYHPNVSQIPGGSQTPTSLGWKKVHNLSLSNGLVSAVEISNDGDKVYFGSSDGKLFRLNNAQTEIEFQVTSITSSIFPEAGYVSSIAVDPDDNEHVVVVFSNYNVPSIFESHDGGASFDDISGNLEENPDGTGSGPSIRWIEIIPKSNSDLFLAGTSVGLYSTESTSGNGTLWVKESPDEIGSAIITMMDYRPVDGRLVIATHGNGVFETQIPDFKPLTFESQGQSFEVLSSYPNPFARDTQIEYSIPEAGNVRIDILTAGGELINTILWGPQFAGKNSVVWDGTTPSGISLANGIYLYRISYNGQQKSGRVILRR